MTVTIESPIKEPQLVPNVPPAARTWRDDIFDRVLAEDSEYQQAQTDIASYKARISELERLHNEMHDQLADCVDEDDEDRMWNAIVDVQREIAVCQAKIRKVQRALPAIEKQAFDRRIASEREKVNELQETADQLKISDEAAEKIAGIDFGTEAALALYKMRQKHLEAMSVLGERQQFLQRLEKVYSLRYSDNG